MKFNPVVNKALTFLPKLSREAWALKAEISRQRYPIGMTQAVTLCWHCEGCGAPRHPGPTAHLSCFCTIVNSMLYMELLVVRTMPVQSYCFGHHTERTLHSLYPTSSVSQAFIDLQAHGAQVILFFRLSPACGCSSARAHGTGA